MSSVAEIPDNKKVMRELTEARFDQIIVALSDLHTNSAATESHQGATVPALSITSKPADVSDVLRDSGDPSIQGFRLALGCDSTQRPLAAAFRSASMHPPVG